MEKIASFTVNHEILEPGIYISREDEAGNETIVTYDLRLTRPNREPVLNTAEIHTLEHLGATYLRNHETLKQDILYFGPMGCRTGFYLLLKGNHDHETVYQLLLDLFSFAAAYEGEIPGASALECGNYLDQNLPMAKYAAKRYLNDLQALDSLDFTYKE